MCERKHIDEDELEEVFSEAAKLVIEKKKLKGVPIARYDLDTKKAYLEYPDGSRVYAEA
ncbi:MAG: hypothetical protein K6G90_06130 [Clostridia bacterium]|nr:hypothetical protein [Clostridia bacterium]